MICRTNKVSKVPRKAGIVMRKNLCRALAPSILAASYIESSMDWKEER